MWWYGAPASAYAELVRRIVSTPAWCDDRGPAPVWAEIPAAKLRMAWQNRWFADGALARGVDRQVKKKFSAMLSDRALQVRLPAVIAQSQMRTRRLRMVAMLQRA